MSSSQAPAVASASGTQVQWRTRKWWQSTRLEKIGWGFTVPFIFLFLLSFIIPIFSSVYSSFFTRKISEGGFGEMVEVFDGFSNYHEVLTGTDFWYGLLNVFEYGVIKIPLVIGSALIIALIIDSLAAHGVKFFRLAIFLPYAVPGVVGSIMWAYLYAPILTPFGPVLEFLGLPRDFFVQDWILNLSMTNMTAWTYIGYNAIIFLATLKSVPTELYEAARIDGASELQVVRRIKLPMLKNAALMTVLMSIIGTVQWFNEPTVLRSLVTTIPSDYTPMMMAYAEAFGANNMGTANAISVLMAILAGMLAGLYVFVQLRIGK